MPHWPAGGSFFCAISRSGLTIYLRQYAAISRIIKEQGKASAFKKAERGKFEAV